MYDLKMPKGNTEVQEMRNGSGNEVGSPPLSNIILPIMNSVFNYFIWHGLKQWPLSGLWG